MEKRHNKQTPGETNQGGSAEPDWHKRRKLHDRKQQGTPQKRIQEANTGKSTTITEKNLKP